MPVSQFPEIVPPEIQINTMYVGADALTVEQSVATPIEQQLSGVDNMNYMFSLNSNIGIMRLIVSFDVATNPNTDQVLTQIRQNQAEPMLPMDVRNYGVTVQKSRFAPLMMFSLYSPNETRDAAFLANYAYINLSDQLLRVPGIAMVSIFGAGQYSIRIWVKPDTLAKLSITVPQIIDAIQKQNAVNPAGQIGAEPSPPGQEFTYAVRAQGRLISEQEFGEIIIRANPDGSIVRLKDVARIDLGTQVYNIRGRLNGKPAANIAVYQLPGTNAIAAAQGARKVMEEARERFPADLDYALGLDTTRAITEGINEIVKTLFIAIILVIIVVFIFLQGWRPTLIPTIAVPVSLIGTFAFFPFLGFSINTLSIFGLVLAIGLVVDNAIIVVEAVERHMDEGMAPKEAALKTMEEVSGPMIAIALVLSAVFIPTIFIPGITGRLYQQFAATIAISVLISTFNALSLSPALCALLLKPKSDSHGPLEKFYSLFNRAFGRATNGYVSFSGTLIRKSVLSLIFLAGITVVSAGIGKAIPAGFLPEEDQGYMFINLALPDAASLQRTDAACKKIEEILANTPGVKYYTTVVGVSLLSIVQNTYSGFFFVNLKEWKYREKPEEQYEAIMAHLNRELGKLPEGIAFAFSPPAIPGIGTAGGVTLVLEDRAGKDIPYLAENVNKFLEAARQRPELERVTTTFLPGVPQIFINVDRDKVLKQGTDLKQVYQTLQTFMGGYFVNYFNRFGRQWQVYVQAEGEYRNKADKGGAVLRTKRKRRSCAALGGNDD